MDPLVPLSYFLSSEGNIFPKIGIILFLLLMSAFFSMTETAFTCCNRVKLKVKADEGKRSAKLVVKMLDKHDNFIVTILVGNNIANITVSTVATILAIGIVKDKGLATIISTAIMTVLVFIFGEIIPKNIAKENSDKVAQIVCYPLWFIMIILYPISFVFMGIIFLVKKIFKDNSKDSSMTEDDFQDFVDNIEETGAINEAESDIIQAAVDFGDITVEKVMTTLENVEMLSASDLSKNKILDILLKTDFSRIPVYQNDKDNIIGILHVRTFLKKAITPSKFTVKSLLKEPFYISKDIELNDMVRLFKEKKSHLAIVKENSKTLGIVTMEDVLEELVGDVHEIKEDIDNE